jgi:death on curing protein
VKNWRWLSLQVITAIHEEQIAEHGGASGTRDSGLIESAIARPMNRANYEKPDTAELSAAYAYALCRNHPFVDGNKRTAYVAARLFMELHGLHLTASQPDKVIVMLRLANGSMTETEFAAWLRENSLKKQD